MYGIQGHILILKWLNSVPNMLSTCIFWLSPLGEQEIGTVVRTLTAQQCGYNQSTKVDDQKSN